MKQQKLSLESVQQVLEDASKMYVTNIMFYGGEPLMHPGLPEMIKKTVACQMAPQMTTNGVLLKEKIDGLYEAGLRNIGIGFYGVGDAYDKYVAKPGSFERLDKSLAYVREQYGDSVNLTICWLLNAKSCTVKSLEEAWAFTEKYDCRFNVSLADHSIPYFTYGQDGDLEFTESDSVRLNWVVEKMLQYKKEQPERFSMSLPSIRSIPDWFRLGKDMPVPCNAYRRIWIAADGSVQLCNVTFKLGNINEQRLSEILNTREHKKAVQDAFKLNCPNCNCGYAARIDEHGASLRLYGQNLTPIG